MATRAVVLGQRPNRPSFLSAGLIGGGGLLGLAATQNVMLALALVLATGLALLLASNIYALPIFLMCTMFVESLELGPGLRIGRVAGALALAALLYYGLAHGRVALRVSGLLAVSGAYGLWLLASLYWADEPSGVYTYLFSYVLAIAYLLAMAMLVRTAEHLRGIFTTLAFGSLVFGLIAFVSFARTGGSYSPEELDNVRAAGLQGDPNYFAVYQTAALPAALVLAARERRPLFRLAYFAIVLMIVLSVASSLSRTGMMALVAVALGTLVLPWRIFFRRAADKVTYAFTLVLAIGAAVAVGSTAFVSRVQSILDPSSASSDRGSGRTDLWAAAMNGYRDHPYLGLGAGNFRVRALDLLQTTPGVDTSRQYVRQAKAVHNAYLETLVDLGPIGLALFLGVLFLAGRTLVVASRRARAAGSLELERYSLAILLALLGFAVSAVFLSNQLGKLLWTLVGLAIAMDAITRRLPQRELAPALPEAPAASDYDLDVRERLVEQRERRAAEEFEAIRAERKRLARLQATLEARLEDAGPARALPSGGEELEQRVAAVEARAQAIVQRELAMAKTHAQLAARARELEAREQALAAVPAPAAEPEPELEPVVAAAPPPVVEPEPAAAPAGPAVAGAHNLVSLERLVDEAGAGHPADRLEEWRYYLLYLREHAAIDGSLPESFDFLVWDVFGELLDR